MSIYTVTAGRVAKHAKPALKEPKVPVVHVYQFVHMEGKHNYTSKTSAELSVNLFTRHKHPNTI